MKTYHSNVAGCFIWDLYETLWSCTNGWSWKRITETSWSHTTETLLGALFETCLTRRGDVLIGRCCYFLLRCRHDVPSKWRWVFHSGRTCDVTRTHRGAFLRCRYDLLLSGGSLYYNVCLYVLIYIYHTILCSSSKGN